MTYSSLLKRTWRENILFSALIELTYRCNLDCYFCYNDRQFPGEPLSQAEYFRFFEDLCDLGTMNLTFSGGEPLAHPDFFVLGRKARALGFVVRVKTNGHALNGRLARRLKEEVTPFSLDISLHGASAETHDRQTRVPGSFAKLMANLGVMREIGLRVKLKSPLTAWNESEIEAMFALADDWGLPIHFDSQITLRDNGNRDPLRLVPSRAGVARLFEKQRQRATRHPIDQEQNAEDSAEVAESKHCGAGSATVAVDPFGNVYPCVQWRRRVGNLHEHSIQTIWRHSGELAGIRRLAVEAKQKISQNGPSEFGFCPGLAEQETGHSAGLYPAARLLQELRQRSTR
jgi:MoaA/NifB/PqqE/SkfB family radical SAM enzyme